MKVHSLIVFLLTCGLGFNLTPRLSQLLTRRHAIASTAASIGISVTNRTGSDGDDDLSALTVLFYGPVTEESCMTLSGALKECDQKAKHAKVEVPALDPHISLHIQSNGGALIPTFHVCDVIKTLDTPVYTYVDGFAASAASLMAVCGQQRYMTKHSAMLIHQLSGAAAGKLDELEDEMKNMRLFMDYVQDIYSENTNLDRDTLRDLLASDVWLPASKCVEYGMVDKIV